INRGGFKVLPETVVQTLLRHPAVRDAVVVGIPDPRLGAVPVAAVEPLTNAEPPTEKQLRDFVREHLPAHHVPVKVQEVEHLPRTPSLKVSLEAVRTMFMRSEEHTSELQSRENLVCRVLLEKKTKCKIQQPIYY